MQVKHMGSCLSPFLNTGYILACFQSNGIEPKKRFFFKKKMMVRMGTIVVIHSLRTLPCTSLGPLAL